jgi:hypothetical protein
MLILDTREFDFEDRSPYRQLVHSNAETLRRSLAEREISAGFAGGPPTCRVVGL